MDSYRVGATGGGIAVEALAPGMFLPEEGKFQPITLMAFRLVISATACLRWLNVERAIRLGQPLPLPLLVPLLATRDALVAASLTAFVFMRQA